MFSLWPSLSHDLCLSLRNAIRDGIEQIRQWKKRLEIVFDAIDNGSSRRKSNLKGLGEGQVRRAKKALADLAIGCLKKRDPIPSSTVADGAQRYWVVSTPSAFSVTIAALGEDDAFRGRGDDVGAVSSTRRCCKRISGPTRRSTRGQWTSEEDELLHKAVQRYKGKNWKKIGAFA